MIYCTNRLAPNDAGWQRPTPGRLNSPAFQGYPQENGFGHEDWNFNRSMAIEGFLYGYLKYQPAQSKRRDRFNFAFLHFEGQSCRVVGFYLDAQFVVEGSPRNETVLTQKAGDLRRLSDADQLGGRWRGKDAAELTRLVDAHRQDLQWRVRPENAVLLQTSLPLPTDAPFVKARNNHRFEMATDVGQGSFERLWTLSSAMLPEEWDPSGSSTTEGRVIVRLHRFRERDARLVKLAKDAFLKTHGRLFCEVCGFDFGRTYGDDIGKDFIEAHHTIPVSQIQPGAETRVGDLAIVCANCHRMLHRGERWPTVEELRRRLLKNRPKNTLPQLKKNT